MLFQIDFSSLYNDQNVADWRASLFYGNVLFDD